MTSHAPLCSDCAFRNPCSLAARSPHDTCDSSLPSLGSPRTTSLSLQFSLRQELRRRSPDGARRLSGLRRPGSCNPVAVSSSRQFGSIQSEVERTRKQIFEDGFAVFPGMWSKAEVGEVDDVLVMAQEQKKVLKSFLMDVTDVSSRPRQWLHAPGHRCTDGATSPEPYWHHSWQIAGMEGDALQRPSWSATLIVSLSDQTARMFCGGVAVFPGSHWIMNAEVASSTSDRSLLPQSCDVPAAAPMELRLARGDMALLHPLLAYTVAPNVSSSSTRFLVLHLGDATSNQVKSKLCRKASQGVGTLSRSAEFDEEKHMWSGWHSMENLLMDRTTSDAEEMVQLQTEEGNAQLGGWQATMEGLPSGQESPATSPSTRTAPRDLLAWRLRNSALQFMQDGKWSNGLSMLQRRAGLRPTCYWTALQAGRCCMKSAPAGQLRGRAGRKCTLEDGERFLLRAIEIAPGWPLAYAELMRCLALMGRGREQEIPGVMELMKQRCKLEQLCLRYPMDSEILQTCWNDCEALRHESLCL